MEKLFGYSDEAGEDTRLIDCLDMNIAGVAALMSESARNEFLGRMKNEKSLFPERWESKIKN